MSDTTTLTPTQTANIRKWVEALRDPVNKQCMAGCLMDNTGAMCCMGLACVVMGIPHAPISNPDSFENATSSGIIGIRKERFTFPSGAGEVNYPRHEWFLDQFGMGSEEIQHLANMNDKYGKSFADIADYIEGKYL